MPSTLDIQRFDSPQDVPADRNWMADISQSRCHGIVIRNFLSPAELARINTHSARHLNLDGCDQSKSFTHPISLVALNELDQGKLATFHRMVDHYTTHFEMDFGLDLIGRLRELFQFLAGDEKVEVLSDGEGGYFLPATFRVIFPEKNHIHLHCGNQFFERFGKFYREVASAVDVEDQMSFFMVLEKAGKGGELTVYDFTWGEARECDHETNTLTRPDGSSIQLGPDTVGLEMLDLEAGSLLIFQGGSLWHRVEQVYGSRRVTFGGFLGFSHDRERLFFWS